MHALAKVALAATGLVSISLAQAAAQSVATPSAVSTSISTFTCTTCPPTEENRREEAAASFTDGMITHTRVIDGEQRVVRTDNMWGGSPVTTITSADLVFGQDSMLAKTTPPVTRESEDQPELRADIPKLPEGARPGVNRQETTASLPDSGVISEGGIGSFELRLN